jgi:hypothetical protein
VNLDLSIDSFYNVFVSTTKVSEVFSMYKKIFVFHWIVVSIAEDVNPWTNDGGTMWERLPNVVFMARWDSWHTWICKLRLNEFS